MVNSENILAQSVDVNLVTRKKIYTMLRLELTTLNGESRVQNAARKILRRVDSHEMEVNKKLMIFLLMLIVQNVAGSLRQIMSGKSLL